MIRKAVSSLKDTVIALSDLEKAITDDDINFLDSHLIVAVFMDCPYLFKSINNSNMYAFLSMSDSRFNWGGYMDRAGAVRYLRNAENVWVMDSMKDMGEFILEGKWK